MTVLPHLAIQLFSKREDQTLLEALAEYADNAKPDLVVIASKSLCPAGERPERASQQQDWIACGLHVCLRVPPALQERSPWPAIDTNLRPKRAYESRC